MSFSSLTVLANSLFTPLIREILLCNLLFSVDSSVNNVATPKKYCHIIFSSQLFYILPKLTRNDSAVTPLT